MPNANTNRGSKRAEEPLSILELVLLRNLKLGLKDKGFSKFTGVDKKIITDTLDGMFERGYVGEDSKPTEKGFDLLNQSSIPTRDDTLVGLSDLELLLLKTVRPRSKDKELSQVMNVNLQTVSEKLDKLYEMDLITEDQFLTEKGFNLLHKPSTPESSPISRAASNERHAAPARKEEFAPMRTLVIQREIVKVPCRYCGMLNELSKVSLCSQCGAKIP